MENLKTPIELSSFLKKLSPLVVGILLTANNAMANEINPCKELNLGHSGCVDIVVSEFGDKDKFKRAGALCSQTNNLRDLETTGNSYSFNIISAIKITCLFLRRSICMLSGVVSYHILLVVLMR